MIINVVKNLDSSNFKFAKKIGLYLLPCSDNAKASLTINRLHNQIINLDGNIIIHENIDSTCLGKAVLHLNVKGTGRLVICLWCGLY